MIINTLDCRDVLSRWMALADSLEGAEGIQELLAETFAAREALGALDGKVATNRAAYEGEGERPFLVSGRVNGDDDDTALLVLAEDSGTAAEVFNEHMIAEANLAVDDEGRPIDENGEEIFIYINQTDFLG